MTLVANRRSVMTLFSDPRDPQSHRARLVLAEKDIRADVVDIDADNPPIDLCDLNPYNEVPTLVDRDVALYHLTAIMEYLDERFPHPPLMPVDPVSRAHCRLGLYRIERDWYRLAKGLEKSTGEAAETARAALRENIMGAEVIFSRKPYFLSDEMTLADCSIAPILWRLPRYGIELPEAETPALQFYCKRMFARSGFQRSLSKIEREYRGWP